MALLASMDFGDMEVEFEGESNRPLELAMAVAANAEDDPKSVEHAKRLDDWPEWNISIQKELDLHKEFSAWTLVEPPEDANIVRSRLILRYKRDANRMITSHKTRFVAQGFSQAMGIDYNETFAPTAKLLAIQIVTAIAVRNDWEIKQTDIDGAYLNASLKETIYMRQLKG